MAVDNCEPEVIAALEKQGWKVRNRPLRLPLGTRNVYADLLVSRSNEDMEESLLVVEIKCFGNPDLDLDQLYEGIGQYIVYQYVLRIEEVVVPMYLSIPVDAYERLIQTYELEEFFESVPINLVIIDIVDAEIVEWKTWTPF